MQNDLKGLFGKRKELDQRSLNSLIKALESNNQPGFDYIEYKQALARLVEMDIDQATAFKTAFATASTVGLTKDKLLKTAEHYKKVLFAEKQKFDSALQNQMQQRVEAKLTEVNTMKRQIEEYQAKIQQLEEKIAKAQRTIDQADEHVRDAKERITSTQEAFENTLRAILEDIDQDLAQINVLL
jgi:peptidoglycan hydrolase CwlO-like protein